MVLFKCHTCSANVMHKDVSKHVGKCAGPLALTCIDCKTDFFGPRYESHTRCSAPRGADFPIKPQASELPLNSQAPDFPVQPHSRANWTQNARSPIKKGPKAAKKSKLGTASSIHQDVSQQLWKEAGRSALKDPNLTAQQRSLLANACKRNPPVSCKTVTKKLLTVNKKLMTILCAEDLVRELVGMIESEFKNINGPQKEEDTTHLTRNQQLIGPILRASEAPGLKPNQKSLLASLTEDKQKQDNSWKGYVRVLWDTCHHRVEQSASQACKRLVEKMSEIRSKGPSATSLENKEEKKGSGIGKKGKDLKKKGKSKDGKQNNLGLQSGENENGNGSLEDPVNADDSARVKRKKKRKHSAEAEEQVVVENGNGTLEETLTIDDSSSEKKKRKSKKKLANGDENGSVDDADLLKKSKKNEHSKQEENAEESVVNVNGQDEIPAEENAAKKSKKKKHSKHEENSEESVANVNGQDEIPAEEDAVKKSKKKKLKLEDGEESEPRKKSKSTSG